MQQPNIQLMRTLWVPSYTQTRPPPDGIPLAQWHLFLLSRALIENEFEFEMFISLLLQCYPDCIYRETGALAENEFNMENVKKFLNKSVNKRDNDIIPQIARSFQSCLDYSTYRTHTDKSSSKYLYVSHTHAHTESNINEIEWKTGYRKKEREKYSIRWQMSEQIQRK